MGGAQHSANDPRRYVPEGLPEGRLVRLESEAARELADLVSIKYDFVVARESLNELLKMLESRPAASGDEEPSSDSEAVVMRSLFNAAAVSYGRAFKSGVRRTKPDERAAISGHRNEPELLHTHRYILNLRDKHVAHSVSPLEEVHVGAVLGNDDDRGVRSVTHTRLSFTFPDRDKLRMMIQLCRLMANHMGDRQFEAGKHLLSQAEQNLDALYELSLMEISTPVEIEVAGESRIVAKSPRSR